MNTHESEDAHAPHPPSHRSAANFARRRADWRCGALIYQVMVDRFAPSRRLDEKAEHYAAPRRLRDWSELPKHGKRLDEHQVNECEIEFWGGDLDSLRSRLDYIQSLGVDLVYLNPIFHAFTNHKYDATDFFTVDPQYGTRDDLRALADDLHARGLRLMLDGVFNHVGRRSVWFEEAHANEGSPVRDFFTFHNDHPNGYLGWRNVPNLPELRLENPEVRRRLYGDPDSVIQGYIRDADIDGWRLDVAYDLGFEYLAELRDAAHGAKADCSVIGECWNYPEEWLRSLDGIMLMFVRTLLFAYLDGGLAPASFTRIYERLIQDAGMESLLHCHLVLDNHDTPRIASTVEGEAQRRLAWVLHFTMPGCPVIYYGSELGMKGGDDPGCRAPMRWDMAESGTTTSEFVRSLIEMRSANPALKVGDCRMLDAERLFGFVRLTDRARETVIVLVNASADPIEELVALRDSRMMDAEPLECQLTGERVRVATGTIYAKLPPRSARVLRTVDRGDSPGYSMLKRVP